MGRINEHFGNGPGAWKSKKMNRKKVTENIEVRKTTKIAMQIATEKTRQPKEHINVHSG